ncbi:P-loop containing nucleoside triphosphate hydrolase protein [Roridomyces roridus]|uniref:P-loop containing nucleoside triphosphate hydrolase protein n=1 Tax=Roridomyces roridus TaxID=1738132 RepID=A0AAD7CL52_9AGAR|nr:P-loop containing nucleoside triphosphate hydrolase protein [Roridomyces roridus]
MEATFSIVQDIFKAPHPPVAATVCSLSSLTRQILEQFLQTVGDDRVIGVAPAYGEKCVLSVVAFASASQVLIVRFPKNAAKKKEQLSLLHDLVLRAASRKVAFRMDVLATSLYHDFGLQIRSALDLLSVSMGAARESVEARMSAIGGEVNLHKKKMIELFRGEEKLQKNNLSVVALQAWVAWRGATLPDVAARLVKVPRIDTSAFSKKRLAAFAKLVRDACRLDAMKPTIVKNEISEHTFKRGQLGLISGRFKNRIQRLATNQYIEVRPKGGKPVIAREARVDGRSAKLNIKAPLPAGPITAHTHGKDPPSDPERQRADAILRTLQGTFDLAKKPFFQAIWLPGEIIQWPVKSSTRVVPIRFSRPLNDSQRKAVEAIISPDPISLIRGPPGTGKTTVIAAAVCSLSRVASRDRNMWLVAQSNVAVKNIAEKLASVDFLDFKIVVSKDFHYDWHEHLYEKIKGNLIRSDQLPEDLVAADRLLLGSKVILCTLSMISNPSLAAIMVCVPVETVVVDEASQVEIGNLLPVITRYSGSLRKLVFIGDDKQLPPYGQNDIRDLKSVFEMQHLQQKAIFLDTQSCMMPQQLGSFIGRHVYNGLLKTVHPNVQPCCKFIDVEGGKEIKSGSSWTNAAEVRAAICQARKFHRSGKSYRIITPYDANRGALEAALKASKIPWEDKVYCVDSYQGHEDDYIILSLVRTERIGFLAEPRRVNVMLTRCKKGLRILTSRAFVEGPARDSLVGRLASEIGAGAWER